MLRQYVNVIPAQTGNKIITMCEGRDKREMSESVSCHFHEGMAGIVLLTDMPSSQQNYSSHPSMGCLANQRRLFPLGK